MRERNLPHSSQKHEKVHEYTKHIEQVDIVYHEALKCHAQQPGQAVQNGNVAESPVAAHNELQLSVSFSEITSCRPTGSCVRGQPTIYGRNVTNRQSGGSCSHCNKRAFVTRFNRRGEAHISMSDILLQSHIMGDTLLSSFENVHPKFS